MAEGNNREPDVGCNTVFIVALICLTLALVFA